MRFWIDLILINVVFFSIPYLLNIKNQPNPFNFIVNKGVPLKTKLKFFYKKSSSDPFKIFVEYSIFILIALLFDFDTQISSIVAAIIGLVGAVLIFYVGIFLYIFRKPPMILSDLSFTKVGIKILKNKKYVAVILLILLLGAMYLGIYWLSNHLLSYQPSRISIYLGLPVLFGLGYFNVWTYGYTGFYTRTFYSPFIHFIRNFKESNKFNFLLAKDDAYFANFNLYKDLKLESKPNIVIINIESYGALNLRDDFFRSEILEKLKEKGEILKKSNLYSASSYSKPPMFAGGSWLSYTTLLFGTKVSDQNQYELLMKGNKGFDTYQSIPRYLETQGYKNICLCPLGGGYLENVEWDVVSTNLNSHQFITVDDIDYNGKTMQFMDLGVTVPDQYAIHKAKEKIEESKDEPYCLFFSTLNSHTPFNSPLEIEKDWKDIPKIDFKTNDNLPTKREKYKSAIKYQLDFLFDYIEKNKDDNTIYVLFGDHQPPFITKKEMGWETLIHVIAKDKRIVESFEKSGFTSGLNVDDQKVINHEGFMSLFMKALFGVYGKNIKQELPYFETGIHFKNTNSQPILQKIES